LKVYKDIEERFSAKLKSLENQIEEKDRTHEQELKECQEKSETYISQLRSVFEVEKQRLEKRVQDDKDKYERLANSTLEEFEQKLHEEQQAHEDDIEALQDELREKESQNQMDVQQLEHELSLKQQNLETLEKYLKDTKETLNAVQSKHSSAMEQHLDSFNKERKNFMVKIESLGLDLAKGEKEIFSLKQRGEQLEVNMTKKDEVFEAMKKDYAEEKATLVSKLEDVKQRLQKTNDEYMEKKVEFGRELALNSQQNEFLKKKIDELKRQHEELSEKHDEKSKSQKQEFNQELTEMNEKLTLERQALEEKYEQKRKTAKESEANYQKQLSQLEKDKAILQEKLNSSEYKKGELEKKIASDQENFSAQLAQFKDSLTTDKKSSHVEVEKLRKMVQDLEHESSEVKATYEREKALWEGKFHFLEQQRDQTKSDLLDTQKKFELTLLQLQKVRNQDKEEIESSQTAIISSIEQRYQNKISELTESYTQQINDLQDKKAKLEKELKSLNDKFLLDSYGKIGNQNIIEKKVADLMESEKKLLSEIEELKADRDNKVLEHQRKIDSETETLKSKMKEIENKYKEAENKRSLLVFEHEKEKAKWHLEKDYLNTQRNELQESIGKLEKKKEALLRENEKMKNDAKSTRRMGGTLSSGLGTGILRSNNSVNMTSRVSPSPSKRSANDNSGSKAKPFEQYKMTSFEQHLKNVTSKGNLSSNMLSSEADSEECNENLAVGATQI
jgi:chromosome segregation ATPase